MNCNGRADGGRRGVRGPAPAATPGFRFTIPAASPGPAGAQIAVAIRAAAAYTLAVRTVLPLLLAAASCAPGQNTQLGAVLGRGGVARLFETSAYMVVGGVEGCVRCGGRLGLFFGYDHWERTGPASDHPASLDLAGGGLRVQGKGARFRPFLDFGLVAGRTQDNRGLPASSMESRGAAGGQIGFGVAISVSEHWYVRPFAKIVGLSSSEFGGYAGASAGYRF